ncbi:MAG TPA: crosslink repair DNA glycosylase YcaQ family protein [Phototrophicaceae bacterium]|nr:crosslink repair DNA glycosylase YcaQ family protein [Phototrophicaceae bacterium]
MKTLSQEAVRGLLIAAQGLQQRPATPVTKADVSQIIRQMHVLQIDTIHVVARSPYLVLWSRLGDYQPRWLDELLAEGALFEYWSHAASFLPVDDYPLYRRIMVERRTWNENGWRSWLDSHAELVNQLLTHIRDNGPVRSADFERTDGAPGGWWNWKDEKTALEGLWFRGDLMVAKRHNFQRVYELRERILPDWDDARSPAIETVYETFVLNTIRALGVVKAAWIADYFRLPMYLHKRLILRLIDQMAQRGQFQTVQVEGWDVPGYYHPDQQAAIAAAADGHIPVSKTTLLSPFDPIVWDRTRAQELFNFTYQIECYTPAPKRQYGYFTLPILYQNRLIGRLDPKAHRKDGLFEVKALHLEPGVIVDDALVAELKTMLQACAAWHNTPQVIVRQATAPGLAERLSD